MLNSVPFISNITFILKPLTNETKTRPNQSLTRISKHCLNHYTQNRSLRKIDVYSKYWTRCFLRSKGKKCFTIFHGGKNNLISVEGCWQLILNLTSLNLAKWNGFFMYLQTLSVYFRENFSYLYYVAKSL